MELSGPLQACNGTALHFTHSLDESDYWVIDLLDKRGGSLESGVSTINCVPDHNSVILKCDTDALVTKVSR